MLEVVSTPLREGHQKLAPSRSSSSSARRSRRSSGRRSGWGSIRSSSSRYISSSSSSSSGGGSRGASSEAGTFPTSISAQSHHPHADAKQISNLKKSDWIISNMKI